MEFIQSGLLLSSRLYAPKVRKNFAFIMLTAARKDVEMAFGILQSQFAIVCRPARFWDQENLWYIMTTCVILHNMIIEHECGQNLDYTTFDLMGHRVRPVKNANRIEQFLQVYHDSRDADTHNDLQKDLMKEWWKWHGHQ